MSGLRSRLAKLEQSRASPFSMVGVAERMRRMRLRRSHAALDYRDEHGHLQPPNPPRTRDDYAATIARSHPDSMAYRMASRALRGLEGAHQ